MIPQVLVPLFHGFEEIEATCPIDLLRRAEVEVVLASCDTQLEICGRSGIIFRADQLLSQTNPELFDLLLIPGGPGIFELRKNETILSLIRGFAHRQQTIAAICAAPILLKDTGLLESHQYTAHESMVEELPELLSDRTVIQDGNIITSRGAGTALEFSLVLVQHLRGKQKANEIRQSIHA